MNKQLINSEYATRLRRIRADLQKQILAAEDELHEVENLLFGLTDFLNYSARPSKEGDISSETPS
jgi:hypothetical protein